MAAAKREEKTQHPVLMEFRPDHTHQCLRINLVKGCRQVRNHPSEGDVVTSISMVTENVGEDSNELWYATSQFFQLSGLRSVRNGIVV